MKAGIALGSNLGDRGSRMAAAKEFLFSLHEGTIAALSSSLYETEPVGCAPGTAPFLNAVVEIESSLEPHGLLGRLREFERDAGRRETAAKNSPREIDLDLLYAGDTRERTPALDLPHPRLPMRRFVLQPLADIRPDLVVPGQNETVAVLLSRLPPGPEVRMVASCW